MSTPVTTTSATTTRRLSRAAGDGRPAAPVRILHLGLGAFARAHQAWYTEHAADADEWGIAAFTGRSPDLAEALRPQDGLFTLLTRDADGDRAEVVSSLSAVHAADEHDAWLTYWRSPDLAVVTLTVSEAGYARRTDGGLDLHRADVAADLAALRADPTARVTTVPARLLAGLLARRVVGGAPVTLLPCDNLPDNGRVLRAVLEDLARALDATSVGDLLAGAVFGTTMVDRITPAATDADRGVALQVRGTVDLAPVPTEPFSEWVVAGDFPAGRPDWESAGATVVGDVTPYEDRKLWLLNGAHSLLAYAGLLRGHTTVAEAVADPSLRTWLEQWWDEAARHLVLPAHELDDYRTALVGRFTNPRIRHRLAQIAADGSLKLPVRVVPVLRAELAGGRLPDGALRVVAAWTAFLRDHGDVADHGATALLPAVRSTDAQAVAAVLGHLGADLAEDTRLRAAVARLLDDVVPGPGRDQL